MGTSIHKDKSSEGSPGSPMNFLGRRRAAKAAAMGAEEMPGAVNAAGGGAGGFLGQGGLGRKLLNPMGAVLERTGMADTGLGKMLNPLSMFKK